MKGFSVSVFLIWFLLVLSAKAQEIPVQEKDKLVYDFAGMLQSQELQAIQNKLRLFRDSSEHKLVVVIVNDLQGYSVEEFAYKLFNTWKIGKKDFNNGILLLISKNDRKMRFEVGYGMEAAFTDITSKHIIEEQIVPNFKEKKFYVGIDAGIQAAIDHLNKSEDTPIVPKESAKNTPKNFYEETFLGGEVFTFVFPMLLHFVLMIGVGVYYFKKEIPIRFGLVAKTTLFLILGYGAATFLIDFIALSVYALVGKDFNYSDLLMDRLGVRMGIALLFPVLYFIPVLIILLIIKAIFFTKYSGTTFSSSSSSSYSDYSDSSSTSSYSDYSDYSDSYSDYSDSGGSSGGGGSSGSW